LVVYYAYLNPIHEVKAEMRKFKRFYITIWISTNLLFLIGSIVAIVLGVKYDDPYGETEADWITAVHGYFTGAVFLVLVLVLAYHGFKIFNLIRNGPRSKLLSKVSLPRIGFVTFVLFLLFMSRCIYDFIMAAGVTSFNISSGTSNEALFTFVAFCAWEIIPTILVLVLFGNVNSTTLGAFSHLFTCFKSSGEPEVAYSSIRYQKLSHDSLPGSGIFPKAQLFSDPKRYDSDEDSSSSSRTSPISGSLNSNFLISPSTTPGRNLEIH